MNKKEYTYRDFLQSEETKTANKNRENLSAAKPGDFSYGAYKPSTAVTQAQNKLNQQVGNKPQAYTSQWQASLNDTLNKILNREKFNYDLNGDALYQQYKNQHVNLGQQAMMDTMGQAQSMTGGYGNSYAQGAGQQAYHGYLQQLNDKVPELYQLALNQYNREGEDLYNQYGLYADREALDYGRYRDQVGDYNTELERLTNESRYQSEADYNRYMDQYNMAYGQYRDAVGDWQTALNRADSEYWNLYNRDYSQYTDNRDFGYGQYRDQMSDAQWQQNFDYQKQMDALAQKQWQAQFDYGKEQDLIAQKQWQAEFDEAIRQYNIQNGILSGIAAGGTGGTGGTSGGEITDSETLAMQKRLNEMGANIAEDGIWGKETQAAYDKYFGGNGKSDTEAYVRAMSSAGENRNEILAYLNAKKKLGEITQDEYDRLYSSYATAGM